LKEDNIEIKGEFELPPFCRLAYQDQIFVSEFIRTHGSIKQMEQAFGVSYPTIKNRINKIADLLQLAHVQSNFEKQDIIEQLEKGEITAKEAVERIKQ
jgi:hypothetical protein